MSRPVHYAGHGVRGLVFACLSAEVGRRQETRRPVPDQSGRSAWTTYEYTQPRPRTASDLGRVTCRECWTEIARMARQRGV